MGGPVGAAGAAGGRVAFSCSLASVWCITRGKEKRSAGQGRRPEGTWRHGRKGDILMPSGFLPVTHKNVVREKNLFLSRLEGTWRLLDFSLICWIVSMLREVGCRQTWSAMGGQMICPGEESIARKHKTPRISNRRSKV